MTHIIDQLMQMECEIIIPFSFLFWKYPDLFLPHFIIDLPHKTLQDKDAILQAFHLWMDEFSQKEYMAQIAWHLYGDLYIA